MRLIVGQTDTHCGIRLCCENSKDAVNSMVFRELRGTDFMDTTNPFKWRHFQAEIILLCVRWYLRYPLSYRDLEEMMLERGLHVDHTTIYRWVQHYAPELEQRCRSYLKATTDSWRVDETYIKVKKLWMYLYRAVDSQGNTLEFLLSHRRDTEAAKRFFSKALAAPHISTPRVITVDKNAAYPKAFKELKADQIFATQPVGDPEGKRGKLVHLDITRPQAQQYVQCLPSLLGSIGLHAYKRAAGFELSRIMVGGIFGQTHSYEAADNIPHQRSNSSA